MRRHLLLTICVLGCWIIAPAQTDSLFQKAVSAYNGGSYETAASWYHEILDEGQHSAALYYNLGNCYYKLNKIAPSIYYYEKALQLAPNDPEILNNLAFAQNMTVDAIDSLPETGIERIYQSTIGVLTFDQWAYLSIGLSILFVVGYLFYYFFQIASRKRIALVLSLVFLSLTILSVAFAFLQYEAFKNDQPAIIFAEEASVKSEPNQRSERAFLLHEGTKVQVLEELNDWKKIRLANGQTGWLIAEDLKMLKEF